MDVLREISRREERFRKLQEEYRGVQVLAQRRRRSDMSQRQSTSRPSCGGIQHPVDVSDAPMTSAAARECYEESSRGPPEPCTATERRPHDANQDPAMLDFVLKQLEILQRDKARLAEEKLQLEIENRNLHGMLNIKNMSFEITSDGEEDATNSECNFSPRLSQR